MTKRSSKKVAKVVINVTADDSSSENSVLDQFSSTPTVVRDTSNNNDNTADENVQQQLQPAADQSLTPDTNNDKENVPKTASNSSKRKQTPTEKPHKNKAVKTSTNSVATSSSITIDDDEDDNNENHPQQLHKLSFVWNYATRSKDKQYGICNECGDEISTSKWSTSALRRHLIIKHDIPDVCLQNTSNKQQSSDVSRRLKERLHQLCIEAIIRDSLSFNCFNKSGLSKLMKEAVPGYVPIHRNTVTRHLKRLHREHKSKLVQHLKDVEPISITTDFWSDRTNTSYIVLTGHYFINNLELQSKVLAYSSFQHRHTSIQIARTISSKLRQLQILHKINRIVCDGAKNLTNAIDDLYIGSNRIWCIAHRLHLVVATGLALWPKSSKKKTDENENRGSDSSSSSRTTSSSTITKSTSKGSKLTQLTIRNNTSSSSSTITKSTLSPNAQSTNGNNASSSSSTITKSIPSPSTQSTNRINTSSTINKSLSGASSQLINQINSLNILQGSYNEMVYFNEVDHARSYNDDVSIQTMECIAEDRLEHDENINEDDRDSNDDEDDYHEDSNNNNNNNDDDDDDDDDEDDDDDGEDDDDDGEDDDDNEEDDNDNNDDVDNEDPDKDDGEDGEDEDENDDPEDDPEIETIPKDCDLLNVVVDDSLTDSWADGLEFDVNDPTLSKEQKITLSLMTKCRKLIHMIKKSSIFNTYIKNQRNLSKKKRDLIQDVRTRWNSTFLMIHSLKVLRSIIEKLFRDKHSLTKKSKQLRKFNNLELTSSEWNYLEELWKVLRSFYSATKTISGRNYCTIGAAYFILMKLKSYLLDDRKDSSIVKRLKKLLLMKFIHYYEQDRNQLDILKLHAYLDPISYSVLLDVDKRAVELRIKQITSNVVPNINSQSLSTAPASLSSQLTTNSTTTIDVVNSTTTLFTKDSSQKKKVTAMEAFLMTIGDTVTSTSAPKNRASIVEEIYNYRLLVDKFNSGRIPSVTASVEFWKIYGGALPSLFNLAKQLICTPATSVASEAAFSIAAFAARKERSQISADNLSAAIFLKDKLDD